MRKEYSVFVDGRFEMLVPEHLEVFAYTRKNDDAELLVICNFFGNEIECPVKKELDAYELILTNDKENEDANVLKPYEARMYLKRK